jgi:hypothetical protein
MTGYTYSTADDLAAENAKPLADDLVTEEMINEAIRVYRADERIDKCMRTILRAVAPMIASRAWEAPWIDYRLQKLLEAEREACAKIIDDYFGGHAVGDHSLAGLAAAIRARGGTPPARRPGEIDWSAMDRED